MRCDWSRKVFFLNIFLRILNSFYCLVIFFSYYAFGLHNRSIRLPHICVMLLNYFFYVHPVYLLKIFTESVNKWITKLLRFRNCNHNCLLYLADNEHISTMNNPFTIMLFILTKVSILMPFECSFDGFFIRLIKHNFCFFFGTEKFSTQFLINHQ